MMNLIAAANHGMGVMPLWAWIVFYILVFLMLLVDLKSFGKKGQHEVSIKEALQMTAVWIIVSLVFCGLIYLFYPVDSHEKALEFLAGYLIEKSLSMDNLFVFLMLFSCWCSDGRALRVGAGTLRTVPALYGSEDVRT